jgi:hypothetical protein
MIKLPRLNGGAAYAGISSDLQLRDAASKVESIDAASTDLSVHLPPTSLFKPGGPHFYIINVGSHTFGVRPFGGSGRYGVAVPINISYTNAGGSPATATFIISSSGGMWIWVDGEVSITLTESARPNFTLNITTGFGSADFDITWDGYGTFTATPTGDSGDGSSYSVNSLGTLPNFICVVAPNEVASICLREDGTWIASDISTWNAATAISYDSGRSSPCAYEDVASSGGSSGSGPSPSGSSGTSTSGPSGTSSGSAGSSGSNPASSGGSGGSAGSGGSSGGSVGPDRSCFGFCLWFVGSPGSCLINCNGASHASDCDALGGLFTRESCGEMYLFCGFAGDGCALGPNICCQYYTGIGGCPGSC